MNPTLSAVKQRFGILGASPMLEAALDTAVKVAPTDLSVLIMGESGVGKEGFSKVIHAFSARKHQPFIAINCGAIPEGTINSELFGHEKGAFTGATSDRRGYFETVNNGTIFLDEIGEMPVDTQAMLLRILENGEYVRVGASKVEKTNVRVIAATNVRLEEAVRKGKFREDLYYRLSTVPIKVPALRERSEDIYTLFRKFATDFAEKYRMQPIQLDDKARLIFERYPWPGNIRELKNVSEQLSILSQERLISGEDLLTLMPQLLNRQLPSLSDKNKDSGSFEERELMYKLLFDMKNDLNYLKNWVSELIKINNLNMPNTVNVSNMPHINNLGLPSGFREETFEATTYHPSVSPNFSPNFYPEHSENKYDNTAQPIILPKNPTNVFEPSAEVVDESLDMAEHEKSLIIRALKKHNNRRAEAARDLGISERTLYRKIKEYALD